MLSWCGGKCVASAISGEACDQGLSSEGGVFILGGHLVCGVELHASLMNDTPNIADGLANTSQQLKVVSVGRDHVTTVSG